MTEELPTDRRRFMRRAAATTGVVWVAPQLISAVADPAAAASPVLHREEFDINCAEVFPPNPTPALCAPADWSIATDSPNNGTCTDTALMTNVSIIAPMGCTVHSIDAVISFAGGAQCVAGGSSLVTGLGTSVASIQAKPGGIIATTYVVYSC